MAPDRALPSNPGTADWGLLVSAAPHSAGALSDMPRDIPASSGRDSGTLPRTGGSVNPRACGGKAKGWVKAGGAGPHGIPWLNP